MTEHQDPPKLKTLLVLLAFCAIGAGMALFGIFGLLHVIRLPAPHAILLLMVGLLNVAFAPFMVRKQRPK